MSEQFSAHDLPELSRTDWQMVVGDASWAGSTEETTDVVDPGTGRPIARVPAATVHDVDAAVAAARKTFGAGVWSKVPDHERSAILWRVADLIMANANLLATLETRNQGMPYRGAAELTVSEAARTFRYYAGWADKVNGRSSDLERHGRTYQACTRREPIGVAALITPWNAPLMMAAWKLAPALTVGCSCVLKPAEETPLSSLVLAELILEAGVPSGVVNVVTGIGEVAGARLAEHPDVDKLAFTGSTEVGRSIIRAATSNLKKLTLELGGKSPVVVFADADLEAAIPGAAAAIFNNAGQVCTAGSRLFVEASVFDQVIAGVSDIARQLRVGHGMDPRTQMGPLISAHHRDRVMGYIDSGVAEGAELVCGGQSFGDGYFVEPTVLVRTAPEMRAVREEIFGPVLAAMPFDGVPAAIEAANNTRYGLSGSVWTRDFQKANYVARALRSGRVGVNVHPWPDITMPTGGYKESGWGRELGPEGLEVFTETKSVISAIT